MTRFPWNGGHLETTSACGTWSGLGGGVTEAGVVAAGAARQWFRALRTRNAFGMPPVNPGPGTTSAADGGEPSVIPARARNRLLDSGERTRGRNPARPTSVLAKEAGSWNLLRLPKCNQWARATVATDCETAAHANQRDLAAQTMQRQRADDIGLCRRAPRREINTWQQDPCLGVR